MSAQLPLAIAAAPVGRMTVREVPFATAAAMVDYLHRHHDPPKGHVASFGAFKGPCLVGVATLGRPVSRVLQERGWWEVTRVATDGTRNACSALYAHAARYARRHGATNVRTYTLLREPGGSLRGAGWLEDGRVKGRDWSCKSRLRSTPNLGDKRRWRAW